MYKKHKTLNSIIIKVQSIYYIDYYNYLYLWSASDSDGAFLATISEVIVP